MLYPFFMILSERIYIFHRKINSLRELMVLILDGSSEHGLIYGINQAFRFVKGI